MLSIFSCAYWPSVYLLWRNVYLSVLLIFFCFFFFFMLLSCVSCLYTSEIKPDWSHCLQIFSPIPCHFILFMASFAIKKLVSLISSHLLIFVFISIAFGDWPKKTLVWFMLQSILLMFSSRSFIVSCLIVVFMAFWVHFLCTCKGVSSCIANLLNYVFLEV